VHPNIKGNLDIEDGFRKILKDLANNDQDQDVKFFSQRAL
jgi:hypothetical protein